MIPDFFVPNSLIPDQDYSLDLAECTLLRRLAARVAELACQPCQAEKRELWRLHNRLEPVRPVIFPKGYPCGIVILRIPGMRSCRTKIMIIFRFVTI